MTMREAVLEFARLEQQIALLKVQQDRILEWIEGDKNTRTSISQAQRQKERRLRESPGGGKSTREKILELLSSSPGPVMPAEIASKIGATRPIHAIIHEMINRHSEIKRVTGGYVLAK